jgi:hypothetical protein
MDISELLNSLEPTIKIKAETELDDWFCKYVPPVERIISTKAPSVKGSLFSWTDIEGKYSCSFKVPKEHFHFFKKVKKLKVFGLPFLLKDGKYWAVKIADKDDIALGTDIMDYKYGSLWRKENGIDDVTFLPAEEKVIEPVSTKSKLEDILNKRKQLENTKKQIISEVLPEVIATSGLSLDEKRENIENFCENIDIELPKVFKDIKDCEINKDVFGRYTFCIFVKSDSDFDKRSKEVVALRNKGGRIKLDCTDGELCYKFMMDKIFEHIGLDKRLDIDTNHYKNMGDSGDFRAGTMRIDIKTRNKSGSKLCNLLIDESCVKEGYNEFGLVHRKGDLDCKGNERRLEFKGIIETEEVLKKFPKGPQIINSRPKYEITDEDLHCISQTIIRTLLELVQRDDI